MEKLSIISERLKQPLSETSRASKKNLLLIGFISLLVTKLGLMPTQISMLGVTLEQANQTAILLLLIGATIYFLAVFLVTIASDLIAWHLLFAEEHGNMLMNLKDFDISDISRDSVLEQMRLETKLENRSKTVFIVRLVTDLILPIVFSLYGLVSVIDVIWT